MLFSAIKHSIQKISQVSERVFFLQKMALFALKAYMGTAKMSSKITSDWNSSWKHAFQV